MWTITVKWYKVRKTDALKRWVLPKALDIKYNQPNAIDFVNTYCAGYNYVVENARITVNCNSVVHKHCFGWNLYVYKDKAFCNLSIFDPSACMCKQLHFPFRDLDYVQRKRVPYLPQSSCFCAHYRLYTRLPVNNNSTYFQM